jgi:hypothetical protein
VLLARRRSSMGQWTRQEFDSGHGTGGEGRWCARGARERCEGVCWGATERGSAGSEGGRACGGGEWPRNARHGCVHGGVCGREVAGQL